MKMIPKSKMRIGYYVGFSRITGVAYWMGRHFIYIRFKFDTPFLERMDHFEDVGPGEDGFVPVKRVKELSDREEGRLGRKIGY